MFDFRAKPISFLSLLTYANDLFRFGVEGNNYFGLLVSLVILSGFSLVFLLVGI